MPPPRLSSVPVRLFAELLVIVAGAQLLSAAAVAAWLPALTSAQRAGFGVALALLVSAPFVYWRCMSATRGLVNAVARRRGAPGRAPSSTSIRNAALLTAAMQLGGLLATALAATMQLQDIDEAAVTALERSAWEVETRVRDQLRAPEASLQAARASYLSNARMDASMLRAYVASADLEHHALGVRGLGWVERAPRRGLDAYLAIARKERPSFTIRSSGSHDRLFVVRYIEPLTENGADAGYDLAQDPVRRETLTRAIDTGQAAMTAPFARAGADAPTADLLYLLPVYRPGARPETPAARDAALLGLLYMPIQTSRLFADVARGLEGRARVTIRDAAVAAPLFESDADIQSEASRYVATRSIDIGGRRLLVELASKPAFELEAGHSRVAATLVGGAAGSVMLALLVWLLGAGRARAESRAQKMTQELDRLAQVVQHTSNAVIIGDASMRIAWVNAGFTCMTGFTSDEALGRLPSELLGHPEADSAAREAIHAACEAGRPCRVEIRNRRKDGSDCWVSVDLQPVHDRQGQLSGFLEIATDVTQQRETWQRLEAALRENEALLRTLNTHAIVSVADSRGHIVDVNDAFVAISGRGRDELLGQTHQVLASGVHGADFWAGIYATVAAGDSWRGRICNRDQLGRLYWLDTMITPFVGGDGQVERYVTIGIDITAGVESEFALAHERRRLDQIIEGTDAGTWEWNVETGATTFNERWAGIVGHRLDELQPVSIATSRRLTHPEDLDRCATLLERHFSGELPLYEAEVRMRHRDGHWVWVLVRGKLFSRTDDGRPLWMAGTLMDVSARRHAEAALRQSQSFLDRVGRVARVGGWELDLATGAVHWNAETARLLELDPGRPPALEDLLARLDGGAREAMDLALETARTQGIGWDVEWPMTSGGGKTLWVRSVAEVVPGGDGGHPVAAHLVGTLQDVSARRELQTQLRQQNELLENVLANLPCGLAAFDGQRRLLVANREFARLLELPEAFLRDPATTFDLMARHLAQRGEYGDIAADEVDAHVAQRLRIFADQVEPHQFERTRPNGTVLDVRGAPLPGGGIVTAYSDVTARRRAEAEVASSSELLRAALEIVDEAFVLYDPDDRLVLCNDKYRALYALSAEAIVPGATFEQIIRFGAERGQYAEAVGRVDEWVAERMVAHREADRGFMQTLDDGRTLRVIERRMSDGHIVGFRIDVTEFVRARAAAEEASRAKSRFLAHMSHEIRTPMNAVLGMLKLLRRTGLDAGQADYAAKAESAARALLGLLDDVLDFSKIEAGKLSLDPHPFDRDEWLGDVALVLSGCVGSKAVEVLFDIDPALPARLVGDQLRLRQILINLGGNAVKFTEHGTVTVELRVRSRQGRRLIVGFSVSDTGIGISAEQQAAIFEGFAQAEASTTRRFGGTGLGLSITQRLVAMMGGALTVRSAPGAGSTFSFEVPLDDAETADAAPAPDDGAPPPQDALRCLVLDDAPATARLFLQAARQLGWDATAVADAAAAQAAVREACAAGRPHDALFVDADMPWPDPARPARSPLEGGAPGHDGMVILLAHDVLDDSLRRRVDAGQAQAILVKPFFAATLARAVQEARQHRNGRHADPAPAQTRRLDGLRLLVAEDNPNNRQIAFELLSDEGADVVLVEDGAKAVDAVCRGPRRFDAVLMDLQMPVLDGLGATAEIRRHPGLGALPIVAMTANAMDSDRQACLAAGMNDHVGKPFDLDGLVATLLRHTGGTRPAPAPVPANAEAAVEFDIAAALGRFGGKRTPFLRSLHAFIGELPGSHEALGGLLDAGDRAGAGRWAHAQKGLAATLGAQRLSRQARALESLLGEPGKPLPPAAEVVALWRSEAARAGAGLAAAAASMEAEQAPGRAASPADLRPRLEALVALLGDRDMQAEDAFSVLREACGPAAAQRLAPLAAAIDRLDFEDAFGRCRAWLAELEDCAQSAPN